jgi:uncharacterized protein with HEPN domain
MRDDRERLLDIQESIVHIERYTSQGRAAFDQDELIQTWVVHHLQIIGEASRGISQSLRDKYPAVPWTKIIGMRNILVHLYFGIDKEIVGLSWNVTCLISRLRLRLFFANWENSTSLFSFSCCRQLPAPPH